MIDDPMVRAHLAAALVEHARRCRRDAVPLPAALVALVRSLATGGQQRPGVGVMSTPDDAADMDVLALDYRAAAQRLHISDRSVRRLVRDGRLKAVTIAGARRIRTADLADFVNGLPEVTNESEAA
jgi:excisionase family DNA binding protein